MRNYIIWHNGKCHNITASNPSKALRQLKLTTLHDMVMYEALPHGEKVRII